MGVLGPPTVMLEEGPELAGADPDRIAATGARYRGAGGHLTTMTAKVLGTRDQLVGGGAWLGLGAIAFCLQVGQVVGLCRLAGQVLTGVANVLATLASELAAAVSEAQDAQRLAASVNEATQALNNSYETRVRTQVAPPGTLHHVMTPEDAAALAAPIASEIAQAEALQAQANRAVATMDAANQSARIAWQRATAALDFATAQAPIAQAAVTSARARAAQRSHHGSVLGGIVDLGGFLLIGAADVGADALTDGAATPLDEADAGEMADLGKSALSDLTGGGASAGEVAAAEQVAAADATVDGVPLGGQVAEDAVSADSGPGAWGPAEESMGERDAVYQEQITGVPPGEAYWVDGVKFDGFTGGVLQEAKGYYAQFLRSDGRFLSWFKGGDGMVGQAERQLVAAGGTPITWSVAEPEVAQAIRELFAESGISGIKVVYVPPAG